MIDILLQPEPEGHADGYGAHRAPLRLANESAIHAELARHLPTAQLIDLRLDYRADGLRCEVVLSGPHADPDAATAIETALDIRLGANIAVTLVRCSP